MKMKIYRDIPAVRASPATLANKFRNNHNTLRPDLMMIAGTPSQNASETLCRESLTISVRQVWIMDWKGRDDFTRFGG